MGTVGMTMIRAGGASSEATLRTPPDISPKTDRDHSWAWIRWRDIPSSGPTKEIR